MKRWTSSGSHILVNQGLEVREFCKEAALFSGSDHCAHPTFPLLLLLLCCCCCLMPSCRCSKPARVSVLQPERAAVGPDLSSQHLLARLAQTNRMCAMSDWLLHNGENRADASLCMR
jgi:hypothetical protein